MDSIKNRWLSVANQRIQRISPPPPKAKTDIQSGSQLTPSFPLFSALPTELKLKIWGFAAQTPRTIEVHGYGFSVGRHYPARRKLNGNPKLNPPFFSPHPLLHACSLSREIFREQYAARLPEKSKSLVMWSRGWVMTTAHLTSVSGNGMSHRRGGLEHTMHHFLNFKPERDGDWGQGDIFFDNGTSWYEPVSQSEWLLRCGVRRLACDVRAFYRGGQGQTGWRLVEKLSHFEELILVVIPREGGWRRRKGEVKLLEPGDGAREERTEVLKWMAVHNGEIRLLRNRGPLGWREPIVRFMIARKL